MRAGWHIFHLGIKELISLFRDPVLIFLILYTFTFSVYTPSKSAVMDVVNASIALVDEDSGDASRAVYDAMLPPLFLPPELIDWTDINPTMDRGQYTFVVNLPPEMEDELAEDGRPDVQIITDATA